MPPIPYEHWLNPGDNAWQMTAATLVGLMSVPGLVVLYGGVMQKRWSVNSMMLAFVAFAVVLIIWVLWGFKLAFGHPMADLRRQRSRRRAERHDLQSASSGRTSGDTRAAVLGHSELQRQAAIPLVDGFGGPAWHFPKATLVYFQFVFAAITPILMLGAVLGRINFKAWIPFVILWSSFVYTINAFLIWGGGYFAQHGALDYSGGYVIHLAAGVSGFVAAWVIGPETPARSRGRRAEQPVDGRRSAPACCGWAGTASTVVTRTTRAHRRRPRSSPRTCAAPWRSWCGSMWDYITGNKPSLIGTVNGMITGLVVITPAAGYVNGWGAGAMGIIGSARWCSSH